MRLLLAPFFALAFLLHQHPAAAVIVTDGLIHYWPLDAPNGPTAPDMVGSWDLQLRGRATFGAPAVVGVGVLLDGGYLLSAPAVNAFLAADFTLSLWVRWLSMPGKPGLLQFNAQGAAPDLSIDLDLDLRPSVGIGRAGGMGSSKSLADKNWHLLSVVREGNSAFLYLDADVVGTGKGDMTMTNIPTSFRLGLYDASHMFGGVIDDVAIYNRALSPSEIAANAIPEPNAAALLALSVGLFAGARPCRAFNQRRSHPN